MIKSEFKQFFPYDAEEYAAVILFFDNMMRRNFLKTLRKIASQKSGMICETVGYNLPYDCDWIEDGIELWWVCGLHEYHCNISHTMFVESIEIATAIWLKNKQLSLEDSTIEEVNNCIKKIKEIY
ncbi:MAG: hypothetical protein K2H29_07110 [Oscillospiraceae bacterium]|nr:hypothetical protein [Oscillospiraceae bacterium]MDE5884824.1 hypothetical protein [Oscillospiraceae bacterium]